MSEIKSNIIFSNDKKRVLLTINKNHHIAIAGCSNIACLYGEVFIHGFRINSKNSSTQKTYPIASYSTSVFHTIIVNRGSEFENEEDIDQVKESLLPYFPDIKEKLSFHTKFTALVYLLDKSDSTIKLLRHFYPQIMSNFQQNISMKIFNNVYLLENEHHAPTSLIYSLQIEKDILTRINEDDPTNELFTVISIGGKNSGKSTVNRFIANAVLSKNKHKILWLDLDIGQPEFTIPGFMSLIEIKEPILTPPPFHMKTEGGKILFVGKYEIDSLHRRYITILQDLYRKIKTSYITKDSKCILIVNTMGYIKDKGKELMDEIIGIISPQLYILCTGNENFEYTNIYINKKNTVMIEANANKFVNMNQFNLNKSRIIDNGRVARRLRVIGYFSTLFKTFPLVPYSPNPARWPVYVVKMNKFFIYNEPDLPLLEECRLKETLEVTMVALCSFNENNDSGFNQINFEEPDLPIPIAIRFKGVAMKLSYRLTNLDTYGVGIITNVDMVNKTFSICTPVEKDILKNKVQILARGRGLHVPPVFLNCQVNDSYDGYRSLKSINKEWLVCNQTTARGHDSMIKFKSNKDDSKSKKQKIDEKSLIIIDGENKS
ncbi:Polynucleotide 5'-hydroxyl-kinase NOL9 [Strongyloides ratti]|uniref:Polynucleotide 5'-hydroxyl-kinase NOL9 n=1 Tax=Strongyloides ratti TaxID=34506 RepID=A0A090L1B2_STRRB|nr:Polynucleotide 5'-hydroxyl-kinase NOL9 [Strongyloides ratti]CEF61234.1 Polynucleotide 5'-hydroxyl-kinase NOL9 [Strongyloides ratti]